MFIANPNLIHLWFLYDLLIFYATAILLMSAIERVPGRIRRGGAKLFARLVAQGWAPWVLALLTLLTLYPMSQPGLEGSSSFIPPLRVLVAYGVFFGVGWLVYIRREVVDLFVVRLSWHLVLGTVMSLAYLAVLVQAPQAHPTAAHLLGIVLASLAMWLLVFGITGLFLRYFDLESSVGRYLADASYWIYLMHLPITIWMTGLLVSFVWSAFLKFAIVLGTTVAVTLITYHYFVRATVIGAVLNGRRYPRALPQHKPGTPPLGMPLRRAPR